MLMKVPGSGLAKGLAVTLRTMTRRSVTAAVPRRAARPAAAQPRRHRAARGELHGLHAVRPRVPRLVHLHRLAQGDDPGADRAAASGSATCSTGSPSTSRCACTAASASRSARSTRCSGRRSSSTPSYDIRDLTHEQGPARASGCATVPPPPAHDGRRAAKEVDAAQGSRQATGAARCRSTTGRRGAVSVVEVCSAARRGRRGLRRCSSSTTRQLVHAALWLVVSLGALAGLLPVLTAEFVAWVQVLIYVGAVVVLLLFGLDADPGADRRVRRPRLAATGSVAAAVVGGRRPPACS